MNGISPRYIQDKVSNSLVGEQAQLDRGINPFMVMNELEEGLSHHSLITDEEQKKRYKELLSVVREEYEDILKGEVQRAISADEDAITRLCANYIENVRAYTQHEKVRNKYTGKDEEPDERLMRAIEEKIGHPRQPQGRLPSGDHELHRRAVAGRQEVRLSHETPGCTRRSS